MKTERYIKQLKVIGWSGQEKLSKSSVFIVGCGGLGCPVSLYIVSSGIGKVTIIDDDVVSLSNLHRQILFDENDVGLSKVGVACEKLKRINSSVEISPINDRLCINNIEQYINGHDLIIVGCDNLSTRYIVNDACCKMHLPFINASVLGDEGSITFFDITHGCYRCLFPDTLSDKIIPLPEEIGVLGSMVGVIGTATATMAIEVLIGNKSNYINKIFNFDSLTLQMKTFPCSKEDSCQFC